MSDITNILLIALLVLGCLLIGYAIYSLKRLVETIDILRGEIIDIKKDLLPAMKSMAALSDQARTTLQDFERHQQNIDVAVRAVRRFTENVVRLQEKVLERIEPPIDELGSILSGLRRGLQAFTHTWKRTIPPGSATRGGEE